MKRTAYVARTAYDLEHVNRLRAPSFRLITFFLKAGSKSSLSHFPPGTASDGGAGTDNFNFLPEHETIEVHYELDDPYAVAEGGKLELFKRFDEAPLWSLDIAKLGEDWLAHGKHVAAWDGRIPTEAVQKGIPENDGMKHDLAALAVNKAVPDFPDGYVTLEHSPYKLRLTITPATDPEFQLPAQTAWTYFHILIKSIALELGPEEAIPAVLIGDAQHERDKAVRRRLLADGGIPAHDAPQPQRIVLTSNVFRTVIEQLLDDSCYEKYEAFGKDGPHIPLIARISMADSAGAEVKVDQSPKGAVALGKTRFLWDWEDPAERVQATGKAKDFIDAALDCFKDATGPKGDNCHVQRGGKRGAGAKPIFPDQAGYAESSNLTAGQFPFTVSSANTRNWAALSRCWTSGRFKGCTGAVFQPSRMAGDNYIVAVYLANGTRSARLLELDTTDQPLTAPPQIVARTGTIEAYREVHVVRIVRKLGSMQKATDSLGAVAASYAPAFMLVVDSTAGDDYLIADHKGPASPTPVAYNQLCEKVLLETSQWLFVNHVATDAKADHAATTAAFAVRKYEDAVKEAHSILNQRPLPYTEIESTGTELILTVSAGHGVSVGDRIGTSPVTATTPTTVTVSKQGAIAKKVVTGTGQVTRVGDIAAAATRFNKTETEFAWELGGLQITGHPAVSVAIQAPAGASRASNRVTYTTTAAHGLEAAMNVNVAGVGDNSFNGSPLSVAAVPSTTSFTVTLPGPDGCSGGGAVTYLQPVPAVIDRVGSKNGSALFQMSAPHGIQVGDRVRVTGGALPPPFPGEFVVTKAAVKVIFADMAGADQAVQVCNANIEVERTVTLLPNTAGGAVRSAATATITTSAPHGLKPGDTAILSGVNDPSFNGTASVTGIPGPSIFQFASAGPDAMSGGGSAQPADDPMLDRLRITQSKLKAEGIDTIVGYAGDALRIRLPRRPLLDGLSILKGGNNGPAREGISIIQFFDLHTSIQEVRDAGKIVKYVAGAAMVVADSDEQHCLFATFADDGPDTLTHEIGHHLFLPHAKYPTSGDLKPGGVREQFHDDDDEHCMMGYQRPLSGFCGFCQLRLRGWKGTELDRNDQANTKS